MLIKARIPQENKNNPVINIGRRINKCLSCFPNKVKINDPHTISEAPHIRLLKITILICSSDRHSIPPCIKGVNVAIQCITPNIRIIKAMIFPKKISLFLLISVYSFCDTFIMLAIFPPNPDSKVNLYYG